MKTALKLIVLLAMSATASIAQTVVSGHLFNPDGTAPSNGQACFTLLNYKPNVPRVNGVALLGNQTNFCLTVSSSTGVFSATIYGSDVIVPASTRWRVDFKIGGVQQASATYNITGGSYNLDSATPDSQTPAALTTPNAVVTNPTGSQTIAQPDNTGLKVTGHQQEGASFLDGLVAVEGRQITSLAYRLFSVRSPLTSATVKDLFVVENNGTNPSDINFRNASVNVGNNDSAVSAAGTLFQFLSPSGDTSNPIIIKKPGETSAGVTSGFWGRNGNLNLYCGGLASICFLVKAPADSFNRYSLSEFGVIQWGTGSGAQDVGLQRQSAGLLRVTNASSGYGSLEASQLTSTVATGTAPFVVASTTNVANLNASSLSGATFAAPGTIGGTTPGAATFTTVTANTSLTINTGTAITKHLSATATLDFSNVAAIGCSTDLTITVTGAAVGDTVSIGVPNGSVPNSTSFFFGWVSATNTVTIRHCNLVSGDPASGSFRADVWQH